VVSEAWHDVFEAEDAPFNNVVVTVFQKDMDGF
jgi:hypothetical protein